jgi:GT2 family glycosyltransferase
MSITVVIPTWRRPQMLERCLEGVLSQEPGADEILIAARPEDETARSIIERASADAAVRWVPVTEPGHVPPIRAALVAVATDLVAFIDDDAVPEPAWLAALTSVMRDPSVACTGGYVFTEGNQPIVHPDAGRIRWYGKHIGNVGAMESPQPVDVDAVMEGNWCWRTRVMRSLEFDPLLARDDAVLYGLDLCLQAKARGGRVVYTSAARVVHTPGHRAGAFDRHEYARVRRSYGRNYTYIALRRFRGIRRVAFVAWWWLVGERASYGVVTGMVDGLRGRIGRGMVVASFRGKADGLRAWRRRA